MAHSISIRKLLTLTKFSTYYNKYMYTGCLITHNSGALLQKRTFDSGIVMGS